MYYLLPSPLPAATERISKYLQVGISESLKILTTKLMCFQYGLSFDIRFCVRQVVTN